MASPTSNKQSRIYLPQLHPKQRLAFETIANEYMYGGATRGGKSFLTRWQYIMWCGHIYNFTCDIFRFNHDDVIRNHMEGEHSFPELLAGWEKDGLVKINKTEVKFLQTNSVILLEHCGSDDVLKKHQGIPRCARTFEEATQISERHIRWLRGWMTITEDMKNKLPEQIGHLYPKLSKEQLRNFFPKLIYTTNPVGPSAGYFRRYFVHARPQYEIERAPADDGGFMRQYIPALIEDNPSENAADTRRRMSGIGDKAVTDAMLNANWDALTGDFFREYCETKNGQPYHVIPDLAPPEHAFKWRCFDWGFADPFAVYWMFSSDGQAFVDNHGNERWFPKGAIIIYREWYGCNPSKPDEGLRMDNADIAKGIIRRTPELTSGITVTDNFPFQGRGGPTIASDFLKEGCPLTLGDTSRIPGYAHFRSRLIGIEKNALERVPMLYICESCVYLRDYIPALQRSKSDPDDAVDSGEATHSTDAVRIGIQLHPLIKSAPTKPVYQTNGARIVTARELLKQISKQRNGPR